MAQIGIAGCIHVGVAARVADVVVGFDWDGGNREKCCTHGVSVAEIEEMFRGGPGVTPDAAHSGAEARFLAIGRSRAGRYVFVAFTVRRGQDGWSVRPISARFMHAREIERYEQSHPEA